MSLNARVSGGIRGAHLRLTSCWQLDRWAPSLPHYIQALPSSAGWYWHKATCLDTPVHFFFFFGSFCLPPNHTHTHRKDSLSLPPILLALSIIGRVVSQGQLRGDERSLSLNNSQIRYSKLIMEGQKFFKRNIIGCLLQNVSWTSYLLDCKTSIKLPAIVSCKHLFSALCLNWRMKCPHSRFLLFIYLFYTEYIHLYHFNFSNAKFLYSFLCQDQVSRLWQSKPKSCAR